MNVFDWDKIRPKFKKQATRDITIGAAFQQYLDGNSGYEDESSGDLNDLYDVFRAAWIICEHMVGGS
jgi:hypothetical protein